VLQNRSLNRGKWRVPEQTIRDFASEADFAVVFAGLLLRATPADSGRLGVRAFDPYQPEPGYFSLNIKALRVCPPETLGAQ
jgi:hypothetical protein